VSDTYSSVQQLPLGKARVPSPSKVVPARVGAPRITQGLLARPQVASLYPAYGVKVLVACKRRRQPMPKPALSGSGSSSAWRSHGLQLSDRLFVDS
jgi:hypothetical protein